jgi:hypothetical protein
MLVFSADLKRVAATSGPSLDARAALDVMRKSAKAEMGMDLDAAVGRVNALIAEAHDAAKLKSALVKTVPDDAVRAAALDRRLAAIRAELDVTLRPQTQRSR